MSCCCGFTDVSVKGRKEFQISGSMFLFVWMPCCHVVFAGSGNSSVSVVVSFCLPLLLLLIYVPLVKAVFCWAFKAETLLSQNQNRAACTLLDTDRLKHVREAEQQWRKSQRGQQMSLSPSLVAHWILRETACDLSGRENVVVWNDRGEKSSLMSCLLKVQHLFKMTGVELLECTSSHRWSDVTEFSLSSIISRS